MTESPAEATWAVLSEIARERDHQVEDLGFTVEHDDRLGVAGFGWLLARRAVELCVPVQINIDEGFARRLLVEIAAIAVAGIEALDRD